MLVIGWLSIVFGVIVLGITVIHYREFNSLPPLSVSRETVDVLVELFSNCAFKLLPTLGGFLVFIGIMVLRNLRSRKKAEIVPAAPRN